MEKTVNRVIVLGALSAIARATCRLLASQGTSLVLVARNKERLSQIAADLRNRGAGTCHEYVLDLAHEARPRAAELMEMVKLLGGSVDVVLLCYGELGNHELAVNDSAELQKIVYVNFVSAIHWVSAAANIIEKQDHGTLLVLSSVAGDRGRKSNYVYGAAKAGLTTFVEGISHRLSRGKAHALVLKLGFVDTPMTAHVGDKGILWSRPERVAQIIQNLLERNISGVRYVPFFWRWIMLAVRSLPTVVFNKTKF